MYQRGVDGSAQALVDARVISDLIKARRKSVAALAAYEQARLDRHKERAHQPHSAAPDSQYQVEELRRLAPSTISDRYISQTELANFRQLQADRGSGTGL